MNKILEVLPEELSTEQTNTISELLNQSSEEQECDYAWKDVNINHSVETNANGTDEREDTKSTSKGSSKSWENLFMNSKFVIADGYFALHTYAYPQYFNGMLLILDSEKSSDDLRVWIGLQQNQSLVGTAHHSSTIKLTLTATYDFEEKLTNMKIESYIWARTAGAFHPCSTTSQINTIKFIIN